MIRALIFDFDGVIAESVDVKTEAFRELFKDYPDSVDAIEKFHLDNGGMSRYDKFRHIYANILKQELPGERFSELCESFHKLVVDKVVEAPFVEGSIGVLDLCAGKYPMYIVSGTPEGEMKEIVERRALEGYFLGIYGSPDSKTRSIRKILVDNGFKPEEVLFIGDSKNDLQAAEETGVIFIARAVDEEQDWLRSESVKTSFPDLRGVKDYIETQNHL